MGILSVAFVGHFSSVEMGCQTGKTGSVLPVGSWTSKALRMKAVWA
jgi:hypothetical protein